MLGVYIPSFKEEDLYGVFMDIPMGELLEEYRCALRSLHLYFTGSDELVMSPIREFLDAVLSVMESCISERTCMAYGMPLRPQASAGAAAAAVPPPSSGMD